MTPRELDAQWEGMKWRLQFYGMGFKVSDGEEPEE